LPGISRSGGSPNACRRVSGMLLQSAAATFRARIPDASGVRRTGGRARLRGCRRGSEDEFFQAWEIYRSDVCFGNRRGTDLMIPRRIVSMSFHPGIPWRVALQQSSPPLSRTLRSCLTTSPRCYKITANGEVRSSSVSHPKGSPHHLRLSALICGPVLCVFPQPPSITSLSI
jgi:hypothetical protein